MKNPFLTTKYDYCFISLYVSLYVGVKMKIFVVVLQRFMSNKSRRVTIFFRITLYRMEK